MRKEIITAAKLIEDLVLSGDINHEVAYRKLSGLILDVSEDELNHPVIENHDVSIEDAFSGKRNGGMIKNSMENNGIKTLGQLAQKTERELRRMYSIGNISIMSINDVLRDHNLTIKP